MATFPFQVGAVVGLEEIAARYLFGPLGISEHYWPQGPQDEGRGQGGLMLVA